MPIAWLKDWPMVSMSLVIRERTSPVLTPLKYAIGSRWIFVWIAERRDWEIRWLTVASSQCCRKDRAKLPAYMAISSRTISQMRSMSMPVMKPSAMRFVISLSRSGPRIISTEPKAAAMTATTIIGINFLLKPRMRPQLARRSTFSVGTPSCGPGPWGPRRRGCG